MMMDLKRGPGMNTAVRFPWWFRDMETLSELLALCEGKLPVTGGLSHKGPVLWDIHIFC